MEELTREKIEEIKKLLEEIGDTHTNERLNVIRFFWKCESHVSSQELTDIINYSGENINIDFVENTLSILSKLGMANKIELENGPVRYEHKYLGHHHDHMVCIECGKIIEFEDPRLERIQASAADKYDFTLVRHNMIFYGFCNDCSNKRGEELLLQDARTGEMLEVVNLKGGSGVNKKLSSMGIIHGAVLEILNSNNGGQLIVGCAGSRYVLGKGITDKVVVKRIAEEKCLMGQNPSCPYRVEGNVGFEHSCPRSNAVPMSCLKDGDKGFVIRTGGCKRLRRRLFEMGLLNGAEFEVVKYAPLKDPMEIIVRGSHISLRIDEAKHIMVKKIEG